MKSNFRKVSRSSLAHLRLSFSLLLLPVYLMALVMTQNIDALHAAVIFAALHLFMYPGSSGFNAYFDRDIAGIGMLEKPPAITPDLLPLSVGLKITAVLVAFFAGPVMAAGCFFYTTASILYSWDRVRLKQYPFTGWLMTGTGQGFGIFLVTAASLGPDGPVVPSISLLGAAGCMALLMLAASPLLEIFQHEEDARRGDRTISMLLGARGTLLLSGILFMIATTGLCLLVKTAAGGAAAVLLPLTFVPALMLFVRLTLSVFRSGRAPVYREVMPVAIAASTGLNGWCAAVLVLRWFGG